MRIPHGATVPRLHEDSGTPQFAQNVAVAGLGKPHREHVVVDAEGAVASRGASGDTGAGAVAAAVAAPGGGIGIGYAQLAGGGTEAYRWERPAVTRAFVFPTIQKNTTYPRRANPGGRKTPPTSRVKSRDVSPGSVARPGFDSRARMRIVTEPTTTIPIAPSAGIRKLARSDHRLVSGG